MKKVEPGQAQLGSEMVASGLEIRPAPCRGCAVHHCPRVEQVDLDLLHLAGHVLLGLHGWAG